MAWLQLKRTIKLNAQIDLYPCFDCNLFFKGTKLNKYFYYELEYFVLCFKLFDTKQESYYFNSIGF